ncbi:unnamed protein product [Pleuronectes platessa]|uniref:Uncharacterized protein n=1 Tax=Pleuronectes platessa TaxID=8262 RepID=A0A9N7YIN6_PLEPL|nr:unnamed protein product [Pleuronectes platessa]
MLRLSCRLILRSPLLTAGPAALSLPRSPLPFCSSCRRVPLLRGSPAGHPPLPAAGSAKLGPPAALLLLLVGASLLLLAFSLRARCSAATTYIRLSQLERVEENPAEPLGANILPVLSSEN